MPLTHEERAEVNRRNASKSTGPKTEAGKAASRRNALKHGLRAEALALPNEDPAVVAARSDAWNDYYRPGSPAAQHLVNACVAATLLSDRCQRYHDAAVSRQVRKAVDAWDLAREEGTEFLADWLKTNPAGAVRRLTHTAHGCRWLIGEWEDLLAALDDRGGWTGPERDQAIRLLGFRPDFESLKEHPAAWLTRFFALLCCDTTTVAAVETMFQAHHLPDRYRGDYAFNSLPERESCLDALRAMALDALGPLREIEEEMRTSLDGPERAEAVDRALILQDEPSAQLFLRYHAEARTAFHRAYGSLVKALDRDAASDTDAETDADAAPALLPHEPTPAPAEAPSETVSPDEANSVTNPREAAASTAPEGTATAPERPAPPLSASPRPASEARPGGPTPGPERRVA